MQNVQNVRYNHIADEPAANGVTGKDGNTNSTLSDANDMLQTILLFIVVGAGLYLGYELFLKK